MENVTVKKADLTKVVQENRDKHQAIFEEAVQGYKDQALKLLEDHIAQVKNGSLVRVVVNLPMPENHLPDYDRVLKMLEMNIADEVELDEADFSSYVMDDWLWKRQFLTSNSFYSQTAKRMSES